MKNNILIALFSSLALIATGCSSDISNDPESPKATGESILQLEIDKEDLTRSGLESTSFDEGDEVFVVVTDRNNPAVLTDTTKATYTDGRWRLSKKIDLAAETDGVAWSIADVQVYYPYNITSEGYDKETGKINLKFPENLMYGASYGWSKNNPTVRITCKHAMARLTLAMKNNSNEDATIGLLMIRNEGEVNVLGTSGTIGSKGIDQVTDYASYISMYRANNKVPAGQTGYFDLLLPPDPAAIDQMWALNADQGVPLTKLKCELQVNDSIINFDITADNWKEGHQYMYPVNLFKPSEIETDSDEYVDLGLSVLWATCNVGAISPYDTGKFFFWGDTRGYEEGENYTSSEIKFIYQKNVNILLNENIVELNSDNEGTYHLTSTYDAATQNMGDPWRMPTEDEVRELLNNTKMEWDLIDGNYIFKLISKVSGYEGKYIQLPQQQGGFSGYYPFQFNPFSSTEDIAGYWWSSTVGNDNERAMGFEIIWVKRPITASHRMISTYRELGHPIRAVRPKP